MCHTHIFASLSVVTLGTVCLAQRRAFREGVYIEQTPRTPEMNCEVERCLLAFKRLDGVRDKGSPVPGLCQERGLTARALVPRRPCFSNLFSGRPDPLRPTAQCQGVEFPSPAAGLLLSQSITGTLVESLWNCLALALQESESEGHPVTILGCHLGTRQ